MLIDELKQKNLEEKDKTIKVESVCIKGFLIVFPLVVIGIVAYILIKGGANAMIEAPWTTYFLIMLVFAIGFAIHEGIHFITLLAFSKKGKKSVYYGFDPDYLKPYIKTNEAITISQYRILKVLPLIITAIIPYIISYFIGSFILGCASMLLLGMCGVDILLLLRTIGEKGNSYCTFDEYCYGMKVYKVNK